jgi:hypothetical protein
MSRLGSKGVFTMYLTVQGKLDLKISDKKNENITRVGEYFKKQFSFRAPLLFHWTLSFSVIRDRYVPSFLDRES